MERKDKSTLKHLIILTGILLAGGFLSIKVTVATGKLDLTLKQAVDFGLKYNRDILKANEDVKYIAGKQVVERFKILPHFGLSTSYTKSESKFNSLPAEDYSSSLMVSQELFELGKERSSAAQMRALLRNTSLNYEKTEKDVVSEIRKEFYALILMQNQLEARQELLRQYKSRLERAREKQKLKLILEVDVLTEELQVAREELQVNDLENSLRIKRMEFLELIGQKPTRELNLIGEVAFEVPPLEESIGVALENRVELKKAQGEVEDQRIVLADVKWEWLPGLSVDSHYAKGRNILGLTLDNKKTGLGGWQANLYNEYTPWKKSYQSEDNWGIGASLSLPFLSWPYDETRGKRIQEKARLGRVLIEYDQQKTSIELAIRKAYLNLMNVKKGLDIAEQQVKISKKRFEMIQKLREFGKASFFQEENARGQFTSAQGTLFQKQTSFMRMREDFLRARGELPEEETEK